MTCKTCQDDFEAKDMDGEHCYWCKRKQKFVAFAKECGLDCYPDPSGERYVYNLDGSCKGKKGECIELIDELWNALVRAKDRRGQDLITG